MATPFPLELGLDTFGDTSQAPDVVATAIAARTSRIRVGSAVTVLSSDDPVRVFQRFATIDAISSGRAEVALGRGSFIESFPLPLPRTCPGIKIRLTNERRQLARTPQPCSIRLDPTTAQLLAHL